MNDIYAQNWERARAEAEATGLEIVEHGWEQHVIIDEAEQTVYRYPRHEAAAAKLADEVSVLRTINSHTWSVVLPAIIDHNPIFTSYKLVPGEVIIHGQGHLLSDEQCQQIGAGLGAFLTQLHQLDHAIIHEKDTKQTMSLLDYYGERIAQGDQPKAKQRLNELLERTNYDYQVVVHGDLHGPNIVLQPDSKELVGVIDFSEIEIGNPHQEFRKLFMTDERFLEPACDAYGSDLSIDEIKLWAFVNEWANLCYFADNTQNVTYQRALQHLTKWGEL